jgi:hypothetical protein
VGIGPGHAGLIALVMAPDYTSLRLRLNRQATGCGFLQQDEIIESMAFIVNALYLVGPTEFKLGGFQRTSIGVVHVVGDALKQWKQFSVFSFQISVRWFRSAAENKN